MKSVEILGPEKWKSQALSDIAKAQTTQCIADIASSLMAGMLASQREGLNWGDIRQSALRQAMLLYGEIILRLAEDCEKHENEAFAKQENLESSATDETKVNNYKIFIWEDVLRDYSAGMAVGVGQTLEDVLGRFQDHIANQLGAPTKVIECGNPENFTAYVYGGS